MRQLLEVGFGGMSAQGVRGTSDRFGARLCENAHEARMRRIVFSIAFSR
jgi:hypothetical protein